MKQTKSESEDWLNRPNTVGGDVSARRHGFWNMNAVPAPGTRHDQRLGTSADASGNNAKDCVSVGRLHAEEKWSGKN